MPKDLLKGFDRFHNRVYRDQPELMAQLLEEGQDPDYFIISCIDSRANPGTIFDPKPGTFFAHKAMGAIVRPYQQGTALAAALQFALHYQNVKKIIVMGHTHCGAVNALINNIDDDEIASFINVAKEGVTHAREICTHGETDLELHRVAEQQIVLESIQNLKKYPSVAKASAEREIEIKGWLFDMEAGAILEYNDQTDTFEKANT